MKAQEFAESNYYELEDYDEGGYLGIDTKFFAEKLIEFAQYHVQEALKAALDEVPYGGSDEIRYDDVKGILTCYPLNQIK